ncbi:MAG: response regulator [Aquabacterium sp.]|nr:response regulator [Aquabacterium sp.]
MSLIAEVQPAYDTGDVVDTPALARQRSVLCVDDEPNILSALKRLYRSTGYQVFTAESGTLALALLESEKIDLVISDMRMPVMDGAQFLGQVRERWPRITRVLLTGYADVTSTIAAINQGQIHHYITKPWHDEEMLLVVRHAFEHLTLAEDKTQLQDEVKQRNDELKALNESLEQKVEQRTGELTLAHDRLKKNYMTSIKAFSGLIEQRGPSMVGHARRVADVSVRIGKGLKLDEAMVRDLLIASLLHDIGQIGLPDVILSKQLPKMTPEELVRYRLHPSLGEQTLMSLDDMQTVSTIIRAHHERFDGNGFPDGLKGEAIPLGARILALSETYDELQSGHLGSSGLTAVEARTVLRGTGGTQFDPVVLDAFMALFVVAPPVEPAKPLSLATASIVPGMVLAKDFMSEEGVVLLAADQELTVDLIARIRFYEKRTGKDLQVCIKPA